MIYRVLKENSKTVNWIKHEDYTDLESAEKAMKNLKSRNKKRNLKLVQIPEYIGVGYEIYKEDSGELYGVIVEETPSFYYIIQSGKQIETNFDRGMFLKDNFLEKFENGIFKAVDGDPSKIKKYEASIDNNDMFDGDFFIESDEE